MNPKVSIVIVNYNTHEVIKKNITSIFKNLKNFSFEIIVVDNNSTDKSIRELPKEFPNCSFYFLDSNRGFGAGCNYGVKKSKGEYILFLNPDIELIDDSIFHLVEFMEGNQNAVICSGLTLDDEGKVSYCYNSFPDLSWHFKQATGIGLMRQIYRLINYPPIYKNEIFEVDWFHGAFFMVRKNIFDIVNGFDENIFLYFEDTDIQKRIKSLGYKNYCLPMVKVKHMTQASVSSASGRKIYYYHINMGNLLYINKHFNFFEILLTRLFYILGTTLKIIIAPVRGKYRKELSSYVKNHLIVLSVYLTKFNVKKT